MEEQNSIEGDMTLKRLMQDFKVVVQDAESLAKATASDLGDRAKEARARLQTSLESAKANFHKLEERAAQGARAADEVIRAHPYESLGAAFGVGLIVGLIVGRR